MRRAEKWFTRAEMTILWTCLVLIWVLTLASSLGRSLFEVPMTWAPELSGGLLVYLTTMGISPAFAHRSHTSVAVLQRWWRPYEHWADIPTRIASGIYAAILLRYGVETVLTQLRFHVTSPATDWPRWIFSLALPIGMSTMLVRVLLFWPDKPELAAAVAPAGHRASDPC
jgi:C4-dicarboxylate transporter DctQ subunit